MAQDCEKSLLLARAPSAIGRQEALDAADEVGAGDVKCSGDLKDGGERRAIFASFEKANVFRMVSAVESERFLRDSTLFSQSD